MTADLQDLPAEAPGLFAAAEPPAATTDPTGRTP